MSNIEACQCNGVSVAEAKRITEETLQNITNASINGWQRRIPNGFMCDQNT